MTPQLIINQQGFRPCSSLSPKYRDQISAGRSHVTSACGSTFSKRERLSSPWSIELDMIIINHCINCILTYIIVSPCFPPLPLCILCICTAVLSHFSQAIGNLLLQPLQQLRLATARWAMQQTPRGPGDSHGMSGFGLGLQLNSTCLCSQ